MSIFQTGKKAGKQLYEYDQRLLEYSFYLWNNYPEIIAFADFEKHNIFSGEVKPFLKKKQLERKQKKQKAQQDLMKKQMENQIAIDLASQKLSKTKQENNSSPQPVSSGKIESSSNSDNVGTSNFGQSTTQHRLRLPNFSQDEEEEFFGDESGFDESFQTFLKTEFIPGCRDSLFHFYAKFHNFVPIQFRVVGQSGHFLPVPRIAPPSEAKYFLQDNIPFESQLIAYDMSVKTKSQKKDSDIYMSKGMDKMLHFGDDMGLNVGSSKNRRSIMSRENGERMDIWVYMIKRPMICNGIARPVSGLYNVINAHQGWQRNIDLYFQTRMRGMNPIVFLENPEIRDDLPTAQSVDVYEQMQSFRERTGVNPHALAFNQSMQTSETRRLIQEKANMSASQSNYLNLQNLRKETRQMLNDHRSNPNMVDTIGQIYQSHINAMQRIFELGPGKRVTFDRQMPDPKYLLEFRKDVLTAIQSVFGLNRELVVPESKMRTQRDADIYESMLLSHFSEVIADITTILKRCYYACFQNPLIREYVTRLEEKQKEREMAMRYPDTRHVEVVNSNQPAPSRNKTSVGETRNRTKKKDFAEKDNDPLKQHSYESIIKQLPTDMMGKDKNTPEPLRIRPEHIIVLAVKYLRGEMWTFAVSDEIEIQFPYNAPNFDETMKLYNTGLISRDTAQRFVCMINRIPAEDIFFAEEDESIFVTELEQEMQKRRLDLMQKQEQAQQKEREKSQAQEKENTEEIDIGRGVHLTIAQKSNESIQEKHNQMQQSTASTSRSESDKPDIDEKKKNKSKKKSTEKEKHKETIATSKKRDSHLANLDSEKNVRNEPKQKQHKSFEKQSSADKQQEKERHKNINKKKQKK